MSSTKLNQFTGLNIIDIAGSDDLKPTGFTAHNPVPGIRLAEMTEHKRTNAVPIADREQALRGADHEAESSLTKLQR